MNAAATKCAPTINLGKYNTSNRNNSIPVITNASAANARGSFGFLKSSTSTNAIAK